MRISDWSSDACSSDLGITRPMQPFFEELDYCPTPIGPVSLRHRLELTLKREVYEIKLGDEFLMSSLLTASEEALARLGVAALKEIGRASCRERVCQYV